MKTLGQIAFEGLESVLGPDDRMEWQDEADSDVTGAWEAAAQAVRAAVIEECANAVFEYVDVHPDGMYIHDFILSLKVQK